MFPLPSAANAQTWKEHLENGNKALAAGDLSGALTHYHAACGEILGMAQQINHPSFVAR